MASKTSLSNGNEPEELTALLSAFDVQNGGTSVIVLYVGKDGKRRRLKGEIFLKPADWPEQVREPSDLPQFECWGDNLLTLMGVAMRLMYGLDYELAEAEWKKAGIFRA